MPQQRPTAWALALALLASLLFSGPTAVVLGAEPKPQCTGWTDELHPPQTVRVLRKYGPNAGRVEVVDFWKYVGTVVRTEYSSGSDKPYPWTHIGALSVKQYAWYYAGHWRGGKVTIYNPDGTVAEVQCYDLKDTTADQIYRPERRDAVTGEWVPANVPTPANLSAMRATWHISLRKWQVDKNRSRIFLTGYRSGRQNPCGSDARGFRIMQKSLRDCGVKKLTFEEVMREYYEPNMLLVDTRHNDILADGSDWFGDLGLLAQGSGGTQWRVYPGTSDSFRAAKVGTFDVSFDSVVGHGSGNVDLVDSNGANDHKLLSDVMLLTNDGSPKLRVGQSNGDGFASLVTTDVPAGVGAERLVVADFDGDLRVDAGLLSSVDGVGKLVVMRSTSGGAFGSPVDWWTGPLNLETDTALAGDTNGDGKSDLIVRDAAGTYSVAASSPSCLVLTPWGPCQAVGPVGLGVATPWLSTNWPAADVKHVVGDYDRDGRDDVVAVVNSGGVKVMGLRAKMDGTFAEPAELWSGGLSFADVHPVAVDVNPDGMTDVALVQRNGNASDITWLKTIERSTTPARMSPTTTYTDTNLSWSGGLRTF